MAENLGGNEAELRLVVRAAFSPQELRDLFGAWSLPAPADAPNADLARLLVRDGARVFGAAELVRRLRAERPLVEWPEAPAPDSALGDDATHVDPAPPVPPSLEAPPTASPSDDAPASRAPLSRGEAWPGLGTDPRPERRAAPNRWLWISVGLGVALALVAFVAGYAWSRRAHTAPSVAAGERGLPVAPLAIGVMHAELRGVEVGCRLEPRDTPTRAILEDAQSECGVKRFTPTEATRAGEGARPVETSEPAARPPRPPESRPSKLPAVPGASCLGGCSKERARCESACGPEPRDASQYDTYQGCKSKCGAADSRCRLGCP